MAMIARAFIGQDPFVVWGTGRQVRNWTHVDDVVEATILAAERIDDGSAINVGTTERTKVVEAVHMILAKAGRTAKLAFDTTKPTGPYNRVCSNALAKRLLGWEPRITFQQGVAATLDWYFKTHERAAIASSLESRLTERTGA
jgi:nucleoside-diphosphate-sugar epimerase